MDAKIAEVIEAIELDAQRIRYIMPSTSKEIYLHCVYLRELLELPAKERPSEPLTKKEKKNLK